MSEGASEDAPVLTIRGLRKTFGHVTALAGVDLEVRRGEIHALVGQNGSGKSTLIKILAGVHAPDPGAVLQVDQRVLAPGSSRATHDAGVRFVHQDLGLVDNLSSVDNLALGFGYASARAGRIDWRQQRANAREALGHVVDDFPLDLPVSRLTSFQRTALAIARALQDWRENGALLVLDEPTATMPRAQVEHLFHLLRRIRERGTSVLLVTHHLEEVFAVADRVTVLRDGAVVATADVAEVDAAALVRQMTGGLEGGRPDVGAAVLGDVVLELHGLAGRVVRGVDLDVRRGEIVGVAGLSGSGREELCSLVFGSASRQGSVRLDGTLIASGRPDQSVQARMGLVPADRHRHGLVMGHSVRRNLTLATLGTFVRTGRIRHQHERAAVSSAIHRFGIKAPSGDAGVASLSGGNQQKVVLAKWLALQPTVLLLDEPTQGVDVAAQADLHRLIREAAEAGAAVVVCSSDELELAGLCHRVAVMRDGRVATELVGDEATAEAIFDATLQASSPR